ncbi:hypothetical protein [Psychrobacter lutiphocae]|uniref:hypothetical protein n=1 Tax=Psychrobacter lutiphocae TaxID=540500 RepID=UPI000366A30A|nr:hypothetical protein [Psychrobacter lutiphocae]
MPRFYAMITVTADLDVVDENNQPTNGFVITIEFQSPNLQNAKQDAFKIFQQSNIYKEQLKPLINKIINVEIDDVMEIMSTDSNETIYGPVVLF